MVRLIGALLLVLLLASPGLAQQSLVGTYKLVSNVVELDGKPSQLMGKAPHGYLVLTPTRFIMFYTAENRKFGTSVNDKAALLDTMVATSGTYRIEGDKLINTIDASWVENLNGTNRVQTWQLSGNRLTAASEPNFSPRYPSKTVIERRVWEKIE
jgi:hypothetical protein